MNVVSISEVSARDADRVGGKGANLGEMARAGLPVPPGFCLVTDAYRRTLERAGLWPFIRDRLRAAPASAARGTGALAAAAAEIRARVEALPLAEDVATAVVDAYRRLGRDVPVAVRSSATAEDLPDASFAGQQDTYLGVRGEADLLRAIRKCWGSLWTGRAVAYREHSGFAHEDVTLAVVMQQMVEADTAGVMFTANPVSGRRDEMVINAAYGLGEGVVSGSVTPDVFQVAHRLPLEVRSRVLGAKETRVASSPGGGAHPEPVSVHDRERFCLDDARLGALVSLGVLLEEQYGAPQDVEWAFAGGEVFLLQTRPITTLDAGPARPGAASRRPTRLEHRVLDDILEHFPDPPFPLDYDAVADAYQQLLHAGAELGWDVPDARALIRIDALGLPYLVPGRPRPTLRLLALPFAVRRLLRQDPALWFTDVGPRFDREVRAFKTRRLEHLNDEALADFVARALRTAHEVGRIRFARYVIPMMLRGLALKAWVRATGAGRVEWGDLLQGLDYRTAVIDRALARLARVAQELPAVRDALLHLPAAEALASLERPEGAQRFREELAHLLEEHGARTTKVYLPFSHRSWREDPTLVVAALQPLLRSGTQGAGAKEEAARRYHALGTRVASRLPRPLARLFFRSLERFRQGHRAREASLYLIEELYGVARSGVHEAARRLAAKGALASPEDAIFLTLEELDAALRGRGTAAAARRLTARRRGARARAATSWRPAPGALPASAGEVLRGQAGSPGTAIGPARVVSGPEAFSSLRSGDVLVCRYTDPTWTPLFSLASAVVADSGGPLSHAAIVAREYGIPAVLGAQGATSRFRDGDTLQVDGTQGWVRAVEERPASVRSEAERLPS